MRRRDFLTVLSGVAAWPMAAHAQQANRVRRIGVLVNLAADDPGMKPRLIVFRQELERLGWIEGRNVHVDYRYAPGGARVEELAKELVALKPDVILAHTVSAAAALQRETRAIPIVFVSVGDPFGAGFIASLSRPGGNLTGLTTFEASIPGKWITMLKQVAPHLTRVMVMGNPKTTTYDYYLSGAEAAAGALALKVVPARVESVSDIERAIEVFARAPDSALVVPPDSSTVMHGQLIIALAAQHRLPAIYAFSFLVKAGGLMSFGTDRVAEMRQAVSSYVDRILRGAAPSDLPVQAPTNFEFAINLKTARAQGLEAPLSLLAEADIVIE
jgi:putative tryptophan/tyrosine transport system substrate-binding protein